MDKVVRIEYPDKAIALIIMEDKEHQNMLTPKLIEEIREAFSFIKRNDDLRAVVVTGFDTYFCCGSDKEGLARLTNGESDFTQQYNIFDCPIDCELPTIAAVQGHAIGGGLAFACTFDFFILSLESIFNANFMKYGFTPGMAATYNLPRCFGEKLGNEMLFSARNYKGQELKERNPSLPIYERKLVLEKALELARSFSENTRTSTKILKEHLVAPIKQRMPEILKSEVWMHAQTITSSEVKERISLLFDKKGGDEK